MEKRSQILYLDENSLQIIKDVQEYQGVTTEGEAADTLIQKGYEWFCSRKTSKYDPLHLKQSFADFVDEAEKACESGYRKEIPFHVLLMLKGILDYLNTLEDENRQREKANEFLLKQAWRKM